MGWSINYIISGSVYKRAKLLNIIITSSRYALAIHNFLYAAKLNKYRSIRYFRTTNSIYYNSTGSRSNRCNLSTICSGSGFTFISYPTRIAPPAYEQVEFEKAIEASKKEIQEQEERERIERTNAETLVRGLYNSDFEIQARETRRHDADNAEEAELQQAIQASLIEQEAEQIKEFTNNAHHVKRTALIGEYITEQGLDHSETDSEVGDLIDFTRPVQHPSSLVGQLSEGTLETSFLGAVERSSTVPATTVSASMNGELSDTRALRVALDEAKTFAALSKLQRYPALIKAIVACQREVDAIDVSTDEGEEFKQACQEFKNYVVHKIVANKKFKDVKNINQLDNLTGLVGSMKNPGLTQETKQKALETFAVNVEK